MRHNMKEEIKLKFELITNLLFFHTYDSGLQNKSRYNLTDKLVKIVLRCH
jgi:hypothetical protein